MEPVWRLGPCKGSDVVSLKNHHYSAQELKVVPEVIKCTLEERG